MKNKRRNWIVVVIVVIATIANVLGSLGSYSQQSSGQTSQTQGTPPQHKQDRTEFESQFPVADYDPLEDFDIEEKTKRKLKNNRFDNRGRVSNELPIYDDEQRLLVIDSIPVPGLPVAESEIIVIGEILEARAYVSNNKKGVYSEFTVRLDEILKNGSADVSKDTSITADREGGFVRYPNGKKRLYRISGHGMPRVGRQYLLFLNNPEKSPNYNILTGYELKADGVTNLDGFPQFLAYRGMDKTAFIRTVREAIKQPSRTTSKQEE